ncbi:MAG: hypothetical protein OXC57_14360 [Rhodobacteraceae bacterium]|nr:hypothetical protein [Paracoccaceae bacterium]
MSTRCCTDPHAGTPCNHGVKFLSGSVDGPPASSVTQTRICGDGTPGD